METNVLHMVAKLLLSKNKIGIRDTFFMTVYKYYMEE